MGFFDTTDIEVEVDDFGLGEPCTGMLKKTTKKVMKKVLDESKEPLENSNKIAKRLGKKKFRLDKIKIIYKIEASSQKTKVAGAWVSLDDVMEGENVIYVNIFKITEEEKIEKIRKFIQEKDYKLEPGLEKLLFHELRHIADFKILLGLSNIYLKKYYKNDKRTLEILERAASNQVYLSGNLRHQAQNYVEFELFVEETFLESRAELAQRIIRKHIFRSNDLAVDTVIEFMLRNVYEARMKAKEYEYKIIEASKKGTFLEWWRDACLNEDTHLLGRGAMSMIFIAALGNDKLMEKFMEFWNRPSTSKFLLLSEKSLKEFSKELERLKYNSKHLKELIEHTEGRAKDKGINKPIIGYRNSIISVNNIREAMMRNAEKKTLMEINRKMAELKKKGLGK